jgi:hypothetical protein
MTCSCNCRQISRFISKIRKEYLNREDMFKDRITIKNITDKFNEYVLSENYDGSGIRYMLQDLSLTEIKNLIYECNMCNCCDKHQNDKPSNENIFSYNLPFVSERDKEYLSNLNVIEKDIQIFVKEMKDFFENIWREEWLSKIQILESRKIDDLNKLLNNYPSTGGYHILEDSFCFVEEDNINILSDKSKEILGYFYGIHLH